MANVNRKTGINSMQTQKIKKLEEKVEDLRERLRSSNFSVLNMRQMYEGVVGDKQGMQGQMNRLNSMLLGAVLQARGKKLVLKKATLAKLAGYGGIDTKEENDNLIVTPVSLEEMEAMVSDIEEATDDDA